MSGMLGGESVTSPFQWEEDSGDSTASSLLLDTVLQDTIDTDRWALIALVSWPQYSALIGQLPVILTSHWSAGRNTQL